MKLFLSWSGELSKGLASAFNDWVQTMPLGVTTFFSPEDIESGQRSMKVLDENLEASSFGLLFMTPDNLDAKWLHFEAGAIAKTVEKARICPVLFGVTVSEIQGPLASFQARKFERQDMSHLCMDINRACEEIRPEPALNSAFERAWPDLEDVISRTMEAAGKKRDSAQPKSTPVDEILSLCRSIVARLDRPDPGPIPVSLVEDRPAGLRPILDISPALADLLAVRYPNEVLLIKHYGHGSYSEVRADQWRRNWDPVPERIRIDTMKMRRDALMYVLEQLDWTPDLGTKAKRPPRNKSKVNS